MGDTKTRTIVIALTVLVVAALLIGGAFAAGYLKGSMSCKVINVAKATKSLEYSQDASRATAEFTLEQQKRTVETQRQIKESEHECLPTSMPDDFFDSVNQ